MAVFTKQLLSGSPGNGRMIEVAAVASLGDIIHTAVNVANQLDELWLWATVPGAIDRELTLEFGGTTSTDDHIVAGLTAQQGLILVVPGLVLDGGVIVRAFADVTNNVNIAGFVNRIDQS